MKRATHMSKISYLTEWFVEKRGLANGVIFAGTALGGLILPFILDVLLEHYGIASTLRALVRVSLTRYLYLLK